MLFDREEVGTLQMAHKLGIATRARDIGAGDGSHVHNDIGGQQQITIEGQ